MRETLKEALKEVLKEAQKKTQKEAQKEAQKETPLAPSQPSSFVVEHPVKNLAVGFINFALVKVDVDVCDCVVPVP